jgi:hypothetical protein
MAEAARRAAKEGIGFGLIAGVIFALAEMVVAAIMGNSALMPFRMFASILLGAAAMETTPIGTAFIIGSLVHLALSAAYGLIYGLINARFSTETQTNWGRQAGLGLLFGAILWLVNFQIIARILYPWFLTTPQFLQLLLHALFFGLPLSLMYAGAERHVREPRHVVTPA